MTVKGFDLTIFEKNIEIELLDVAESRGEQKVHFLVTRDFFTVEHANLHECRSGV